MGYSTAAASDAAPSGPAASARNRSLSAAPAAASAEPSSAYVRGFDVSAWQPNSSINWASAYAGGARFAYIKATEATTYRSSQFAAQWAASAKVGMLHGAYVFATPNTASGAATADYFVANGGRWTADGRTLPPMLDIESNPYGAECYGLTPAAMVSWIQSFTTEMVKKTGRTPAIYTSISWWKNCTGNSAAFGANPYVPAYWPSTNFAGPGTLGASWKSWNVWQWADSGKFPGDQDVFNGSAAALTSFAMNKSASIAAPKSTAIGHLDAVTAGAGTVNLRGWAADSTTSTSTKVTVTVNGAATTVTASAARPDVGRAYPKQGSAHGFNVTVNAPTGKATACVTASPASGTLTASLGCSTVTVANPSPHGALDTAKVTAAGVTISGWAIDPNTTSPISVQAKVDGQIMQTLTASATRNDVARVYPGAGAKHGFTGTVTAPVGKHTICVTGVNVGAGANATVGSCKTVTISASSPHGALDTAKVTAAGVTIGGWAIDPNTTSPIKVHANVDGRTVQTLTASTTRNDVARAYPKSGAKHGFTGTVPVPAGKHTICTTGVNVGAGTNATVGTCKTVTVK
ncbi:GH25 family lysozyme [Curtobacterium sp. MCSS17_016]|uniref:GH25 family lysozyme n=1 Tax=Curtobacterium sp. MCSS17_016 TaxID=2175644 RepID=UPI001C64CE4F|nr:GH25 family lysozyme [Curtobacterium sp. MCSS17_016]WIE81155.1 GH25 family lysozyme [Curtobacterium sp. MCSS17_016]